MLNQLKKSQYPSGLASDYTMNLENGKETFSFCELIQIWILLFNSGHLPGTFASERGILLALKENKNFLSTMKRGMPDNLKHPFEKSVENNEIYNMHKYIIAFLLKRHTSYSDLCVDKSGNIQSETPNRIISLLIKSLELHIIETNDDKLNKLKFYFNRIRKLSYLFLDSHYTAFPINFNISQFIFSIDSYVNELFSIDSNLNETLDSFDNLLTNDLYNSKDSIRELSLHSTDIFYYLMDNKKNLSSFKYLKNLFENDYDKFDLKINEFNEYKTVYLPFKFNELYSPIKDLFIDKINLNLENELKKLVGINNILTVQGSSNNNLITITIVFRQGNQYNHILAMGRVTKKLIELKKDIIKDLKVKNNSYEIFVEECFKKIFKETVQ